MTVVFILFLYLILFYYVYVVSYEDIMTRTVFSSFALLAGLNALLKMVCSLATSSMSAL